MGKIKLDNGLRIVYEKMPYVNSVSSGVWVGAGSRYENENERGISHLIEHMMFKGTKNRTAKEIAKEIDSIGGKINAFTGKEVTCYYTKTLSTHMEISLDLLSDMLFNSLFDEENLNTEKNVVLEEINLYNDSPEELIHDIIQQTVWPEGTVGRSILGLPEVLKKITRKEVMDYIKRMYYPENCVISIAGNIDEQQLQSQVEKYFGKWPETKPNKNQSITSDFSPGNKRIKRNTEQVHVCTAYKGIKAGTDNIYPVMVINNMLGGGMSSRLFQRIREQYGLVYTIYSYPVFYKNEGIFVIYAGMNPGNLQQVMDLTESEIEELVKQDISDEDFSKAKEQLKGGYIISQESTGARMTAIGKSELLYSRVKTKEEIKNRIEAITKDEVNEFANKILNEKQKGYAYIGKID